MSGCADGDGVVAALEGATVRFGALHALRGIDVTLRRGEITVLLGPNGAGKTTAIRLLLGLTTPAAGTVRVFGRDPRAPAARQRTGALMQVSHVPDMLRVCEHIDTFRSYYPAPLGVAELVAAVGLEGYERRLFGTLSGGEKQRVLLALALAGNPDLLFLDEPSAGMDAASRRRLWQTIRQLRADGRAVLLTTHYLEEADALADRVIVLHHGSIIADGTPAEVKRLTASQRVRCRTTLTRDELRALPHVADVSTDGEFMTLTTAEPEQVLRLLLARDLSLNGLEVAGAGLEESFLALTAANAPRRVASAGGRGVITGEIARGRPGGA